MKFSLMYYPDDPTTEVMEIIKATDELDFYACYLTDSSLRRDLWTLLGAAADKTKRVRLGPNAVRIAFRDPALIALSLATLDELTNGRAEAVVCFGGARFWHQHGLRPEQTSRPWARVKEAIQVMQTFLSTGRLDFEGEYFHYRGLAASVSAVQHRIPIKMATAGGPKAMFAAGQVADGMHIAPASSRAASKAAVARVREGAVANNRAWRDFDIALCPIWVCGDDSAAAKQIARIKTAWYLPTLPRANIELQGISPDTVLRVRRAWAADNVSQAITETTDQVTEQLSIAGTPEECLEKLRRNTDHTGVNHLVAMVTDSAHAKLICAHPVPQVPSIRAQLKLIHERVMPHLDSEPG